VMAVLCTPNSLHFLFMMALVYYISFSTMLQPKLQGSQVWISTIGCYAQYWEY
jgi:hypothetical protein